MSRKHYYPLRFQPIIKSTVWGARRLGRLLGKSLPEKGPVGESWEVADHPHGTSVVANGPLAGKSFHDLIQADAFGIAGPDGVTEKGRFVLLFKFLDADGYTSVQVHPDDEYAREHTDEGSGKTEAWYIIYAEPGARLVRGTQPGIDRESFRRAVRDGHVETTLDFFHVEQGDVIFIPAGVVHALGRGITLAEIQQNSDTTYRVFDWNRKGLDGKPRELHTEQALDVIRFQDIGPGKHPRNLVHPRDPFQENLVTCDYFAMDRLVVEKEFEVPTRSGRFDILAALTGQGQVRYENGAEPFRAGQTLYLPAGLNQAVVQADRQLEFLWIRRPEQVQ